MKKPWVIGFLSIVPGLGLLVLGNFLQGFVILLLIGGLVTIGLFSKGENFSVTVYTLAFTAWVTQGVYAILLSQGQADTKSELGLPVRKVSIAPASPDASRGEKRLHRVRETVLELLPQGEDVKVAIQGWVGGGPFLKSMFETLSRGPTISSIVYLGVTNLELIYVKTDRLYKPSELQRIPLSHVTLAAFKEGLLSDWLDIQSNETGPLKIEVSRSSRNASRLLTEILSGRPNREGLSSRGMQSLESSITPIQGLNTKHPNLVSGLLGAGGGIAGTLVATLLSLPLGIMLGDGSDTGERLGYLIGIYCLIMFPVGGGILGGIPGVIVGILRNITGREPTLLPPFLAGFLTVVVLSLGALTAIYVIPYS